MELRPLCVPLTFGLTRAPASSPSLQGRFWSHQLIAPLGDALVTLMIPLVRLRDIRFRTVIGAHSHVLHLFMVELSLNFSSSGSALSLPVLTFGPVLGPLILSPCRSPRAAARTAPAALLSPSAAGT
jgi:hypothetical protein